jgi:hypothetical protein
MFTLAVPCGLQQLQSLTLREVVLPAVLDSCVHPKLAELSLESCRVNDPHSDGFACVARQLVHLTGLQSLQLCWLSGPDLDPSGAGILAVEQALGQLQQLTCLHLSCRHIIGAAMATASRPSQLQLDVIGSCEQPLQMQWLPSSLTYLRLWQCTVSCAAAGSGGSSSSCWKLPVLQQFLLEAACVAAAAADGSAWV